MAKGLAQAPHWPRSRNGTSRGTTPWRRGWALASSQTSAVTVAREGRAADSPTGQFDGLRRTHPLCAVSSSSPGLRIQGPGLQNPRGHGLPCAAPGRTVGSSGGLTQSGGCSKRRSIPATVPAAPTPLARSAPPTRCPDPARAPPAVYHLSAPLFPPPRPYLYFPCVRLHRTMPCHGTFRVRVLECPALGRPSLIKLVLVKKNCNDFFASRWRTLLVHQAHHRRRRITG